MSTVYVLCWFDTEDIVVPATDDAPLRIAQIFGQRGLRATFKLVGEKLRLLEQRKRTDVIEALRSHDVGYHTNLHSMHPTPAEYLREMDWCEGVAEFVRREEQGVKDIIRIFGNTPACYGQPGGSWAPQAYGALRLWGIPAYVSASSYISMGGRPFHLCGVLSVSRMQPNQMSIGFNIDTAEGLEKLKRTFAERHEALRAEGGGVISIGSHPLHWILDSESCDLLNWGAGRNVPRSAWRCPALKSPERVEAGFKQLAEFLDFAAGMEGVQFVGAQGLAHQFADKTVDAEISLAELLLASAHVTEEIVFQRVNEGFLSAAEVFYLICAAVAEYAAKRRLPDGVSSRQLLGPVRYAQTTGKISILPLQDIFDAASAAVGYAKHYGRIPSEIHADAGVVAPEDFLATAAAVLQALAMKKEPAGVELRKGRLRSPEIVSEEFAKAAWRWRIFPEDFSAPKLLDLAKLQSWSIKPA